MDRLRRELKINDQDPQALTPSPTISPQQLQQLMSMYREGKVRYTKMEKQLIELEKLQTSSRDKLRDVLPTVYPDAALSELLTSLNQAEQKLVSLKSDYSPQHPDVIRIQALVDKLNSQIDARVAGIIAGLQNQAQSEKAALDSLDADVEAAKQTDYEESSRGQPYWEAKRELAAKRQFHDLLATKISAEKLDLGLPKTVMVEITRRAEPGKDPVKPNKTVNIILGVVIGLIVGCGSGILYRIS